MLVLTRKQDQSIHVLDLQGGTITVTVLAVEHGQRTKLGITAPQEYKIYREELLQRMTGTATS